MNLREKTQLLMRRFKGRNDVYARKWYDKETGKGNYSPVCAKFWSAGCHIKLKDGKTCATCAIRETTPVSHDSVVKHITGLEEHSIYVIKENGMINFGAIDFDCKPDRDPKKSYYFDEVRKTSDVLDELGIKHAIARSTSDGFHIYMFFDEEYPSARFLAVVRSLVFERTGFAANNRQGIKLLPELFPKQTSPGGMGGLGNPIKPPMIEPRFQVERNCWVDKDNQMIPANQQWEYFSKIPDNTAKIFDDIIELYDLKVDDKTFIRTKQSSKIVLQGGGIYDTETGHWQPPDGGSMEKMIEGCAAFRRLREKMDKGQSPSHDEGFGLLHCGMQMQDGFKYFEDGKVPGWCATEKDRRQLLQSIEKGYKPCTCVKLQEKGVCIPGTKCFEKRPPRETIHGQELIRDDLPESEWPEPSPVRYGRGDGDDFLQKLLHEVDVVSAETDAEKRGGILKTIVSRAQVFDKNQQSILKQHIEKKKIIGKRDLGKLFNEAEKEKTAEVMKSAHDRSDTIFVNGTTYKKKQPYGYQVARTVKNGGVEYTDLCNFDVWIREVKTTIDEGDVKEVMLKGVIAYDGIEKPFEIATNEFFDNSELFKKLGAIMDIRMTLLKSDLDDARAAWQNFSMKKGYKEIKVQSGPGWTPDDKFITPSIIVEKEGIRENRDRPISIPGDDEFAKQLDFTILNKNELKILMIHILTELRHAYSAGLVMVCIAHMISAMLSTRLGFTQYPTLWIYGKIGRAKTALVKLMMMFVGHYIKFPKWATSSPLALAYHGHNHKDMPMFVDDYKAEFNCDEVMAKAVQDSFDRSSDAKMQKDGEKKRRSKQYKSHLIGTGEDVLSNVESVVSRMLLVEVDSPPEKGEDLYRRCLEKQSLYRGIFPHLIHYFLNMPEEKWREAFIFESKGFKEGLLGKNVAQRISTNLAQNQVCLRVFADFAVSLDVLSDQEREDIICEHRSFLMKIGRETAERCGEEQTAVIFRDALVGLIQTKALSIMGLPGYDDSLVNIGYYDRSKSMDHVFLTVSVVTERVRQNLSHRKIRFSNQTLSSRLKELKFLVDSAESFRIQGENGKKGDNKKHWKVPLVQLFGEDEAKAIVSSQSIQKEWFEKSQVRPDQVDLN